MFDERVALEEVDCLLFLTIQFKGVISVLFFVLLFQCNDYVLLCAV